MARHGPARHGPQAEDAAGVRALLEKHAEELAKARSWWLWLALLDMLHMRARTCIHPSIPPCIHSPAAAPPPSSSLLIVNVHTTHAHTHNHTNKQDGNAGLAERVAAQVTVKHLQKLARTFLTLSLTGE